MVWKGRMRLLWGKKAKVLVPLIALTVENRDLGMAVSGTILWSHWASPPTQMVFNPFTFLDSIHI